MLEISTETHCNLASDAEPITMRLFGPMMAGTVSGRSFLPRSRRSRAILGILALANGTPVSRSLLIDLLWPQRARFLALNSLRQSIYEVRKKMAGWTGIDLISVGNQVMLRAPGMWLDADYVGTSAFNVADLSDVLRGPLMGDLLGISRNFDDWVFAKQKAINSIICLQTNKFLGASRSDFETTQIAEAILAYDPDFEGAWLALTRIYSALDNPWAFEKVYRRCIVEVSRIRCGWTFKSEAVQPLYGPGVYEALATQAHMTRVTLPSALLGGWKTRAPDILSSSVRLCITPMKAIGHANQDAATSLNWKLFFNLTIREQFLSVPLESGIDDAQILNKLPPTNSDFMLESLLEGWSGEYQFLLRLRDQHKGGAVIWCFQLKQPALSVYLNQIDVALFLANQVAAEVTRIQ